MKVHTDINALPPFHNAVVTIGTFDGLHLGHCRILEQLNREARSIGGESVIITFHPHPRKIISPDKPGLYLINTPEEKKALLEKLGIDHLVIVPFTENFADQSAEEYVEDFLIRRFHPHTLIIGYDHRFGKDRKGDFRLLEEYHRKAGFRLIEIPEHVLNESAISSTRIRECLLNGNIGEASELLGYAYFFEGLVVRGNQLGRTIGYPTANLELLHAEKLVPGNGVYAVTVQLKRNDPAEGVSGDWEGKTFRGMMNIGTRPTVDGTKRVIEVNIFDFDADIYRWHMVVHVRQFLRKEERFSGLDALKSQLAVDEINALQVLKNIGDDQDTFR